jgi:hypothetical protein
MRVSASIMIGFMLLVTAATQAFAHRPPFGWDYPFECCSEADCARIDASAVRETPTGYVVTIMPGRHPMWATERRRSVVLDIPYQKTRLSPDGFFHLCMNDTGELLCFFSPGGGS